MRRPKASAAIVVTVLGAVAIVGCGWPDYAVRGSDASREEPTDGGDDTALATCTGGLRSGEALECACTSGDAGVGDAADDAQSAEVAAGDAASGYQACTREGRLGSCLGCPDQSSCDLVVAPPGRTCVPGGIVTLGATNREVCPPDGCAVERPEHSVALTRYFLDTREVTVKRFRDWWRAGRVTPQVGAPIFVAGDGTTLEWSDAWSVQPPLGASESEGGTWLGPDDPTNDDLPIVGVDWPTALAFCVASGGRLPTEAEWESAASGRTGRLFPREPEETRNAAPTGAMLPCTRAISAVSNCGGPTGAGTAERFSVDGVYDLVGNVAEWILDGAPPGGSGCTSGCYPAAKTADPLLHPRSDQRGVRGGSWKEREPARLRTQARAFAALAARDTATGIRCAYRR